MGRVPPEMLSFDRSWFALRHVLQRLGARVDTRAAWQRLSAAAPIDPPLTPTCPRPDPGSNAEGAAHDPA
jgi:hypothetical protein